MSGKVTRHHLVSNLQLWCKGAELKGFSVCLSVCLSVSLSLSLTLCLSVSASLLSPSPPLCLSLSPSLSCSLLSLCPFLSLSLLLPLSLSFSLCLCPCLSLSEAGQISEEASSDKAGVKADGCQLDTLSKPPATLGPSHTRASECDIDALRAVESCSKEAVFWRGVRWTQRTVDRVQQKCNKD